MSEEMDTYEKLRDRLDEIIEEEFQALEEYRKTLVEGDTQHSWALYILRRQLVANRTIAQLLTLLDANQQR